MSYVSRIMFLYKLIDDELYIGNIVCLLRSYIAGKHCIIIVPQYNVNKLNKNIFMLGNLQYNLLSSPKLLLTPIKHHINQVNNQKFQNTLHVCTILRSRVDAHTSRVFTNKSSLFYCLAPAPPHGVRFRPPGHRTMYT